MVERGGASGADRAAGVRGAARALPGSRCRYKLDAREGGSPSREGRSLSSTPARGAQGSCHVPRMASTIRRIALIAPPWYPVPPDGYGGTELVVALLATELRARGLHVELFAAEGSALASHQVAPRQWSAALGGRDEHVRDLTYARRVLDLIDGSGPFDVIHDHSGGAVLVGLTARAAAPVIHTVHSSPVIHTVHNSIEEPLRTFLESLAPHGVGLVSVSEAQRRPVAHLPWRGTVHNAVDLSALRVAEPGDKQRYLVSLARICHDKGQHLAIEAARRAGRRLVLAGKVEETPESVGYFEREIAPAIDGDQVIHLQNVAGEEKARLLAGASALLAPLQWDEPFGLYMAEAMASGTPVIAFPRGAAPELITPGTTGFLARSVEEMAEMVHQAEHIDPERCAANARALFAPSRMADGYLAVYERIAALRPALPRITVDATQPAIPWLPALEAPTAQVVGESGAATS